MPPRIMLLLVGLLVAARVRVSRADERSGQPVIVVRYDAPPECPSSESFVESVCAEIARRSSFIGPPVQVIVTIAREDDGYSATAVSDAHGGTLLERTVRAPTCDELTEIAATIVALAQTDVRPPPDPIAPQGPRPVASHEIRSPPPTVGDRTGRALTYSFSLGYGAFTAGPAEPVVRANGQVTTFNPAQGVRLGFGVAHALGWWQQSAHVSVAYYRQSTTTVSAPVDPLPIPSPGASLDDRDVLHATVDACPVHVEYKFLSLIPCVTFSMIESQGTSGYDPNLETGLGASGRIRLGFAKSFFVEALGAAVGLLSSEEPVVSHHVRLFYALSLGVTLP